MHYLFAFSSVQQAKEEVKHDPERETLETRQYDCVFSATEKDFPNCEKSPEPLQQSKRSQLRAQVTSIFLLGKNDPLTGVSPGFLFGWA